VITGTAVSNDAAGELDLQALFQVFLSTQGSARSAGANMELYILPEIDGTNYAYGGTALDPPASALKATFVFDAAVTARYSDTVLVQLPPRNFHVLVKNNTGQALAATLNTVKMMRYNVQSA